MKQVRNDWLGIVTFLQENISGMMPSPIKKVTKDFVDLNTVTSNTLYLQLLQGDFEDSETCNMSVTFWFALIKQDPLEWLDSFNSFIDSNPRLGQNAVICDVLNFDVVDYDDATRKLLKIETDVII